MALFGSKKKISSKVPTETKAVAVKNTANIQNLSHIIVKPHITEKASLKSEKGVYVFQVAKTATKNSIAHAVQELYNVLPVRVRVVPIPAKKVFSQRRGNWGTQKGGKKAYVYLKEGQTIDFV